MRHFPLAATLAVAAALLGLAGAPARAAEPADRGAAAGGPREPSVHSVVVYRERALIAAPQDRVWQLLVDLPRYHEWNPWVVRADGAAEPGAEVTADVVLGKHVMPVRHVVLTVEPQRRFCWRDAGWNSWFVYGERCRTLTPQPDGTVLFEQELLLDGPFTGAADLAMGRALRDGMAAETAALRRTAER